MSLTTIQRVRTYLIAGSPHIQMDRDTVVALCDLAQYGYDSYADRKVEAAERAREKADAAYYAKASRRHLIAMQFVICVTIAVAILRAARII